HAQKDSPSIRTSKQRGSNNRNADGEQAIPTQPDQSILNGDGKQGADPKRGAIRHKFLKRAEGYESEQRNDGGSADEKSSAADQDQHPPGSDPGIQVLDNRAIGMTAPEPHAHDTRDTQYQKQDSENPKPFGRSHCRRSPS